MPTKIEWTDESWNPITGCSKVSAGCANCYAERMAQRHAGRYGYPKDDPFKVTFHPDRLEQPLHWLKPRKVFICSMSDFFHKEVMLSWQYRITETIKATPQHKYLVLTKRPENIIRERGWAYPIGLPNVWLGVSVENPKTAEERIPILLDIPATVRFVSLEPLLEGINITPYLEHLDWVIVGCESGSGARPMNIDWARTVKNQCVDAGVPFFFKQAMVRGKIVKLPELDGRVWAQIPEAK